MARVSHRFISDLVLNKKKVREVRQKERRRGREALFGNGVRKSEQEREKKTIGRTKSSNL